MSHYCLQRPDEPVGVAYAPDSVEHTVVEEGQTHPDWRSFKMTLKGGKATDYLPNDLGLPMVSKKMRQVLDSNRGKADVLEWLPVTVGNTEYFILNTPMRPDVLDKKKSTLAGDSVVQAVLSEKAIDDHHWFRAAARCRSSCPKRSRRPWRPRAAPTSSSTRSPSPARR